MFLLLVGLYMSNGDRNGTQNQEISKEFSLIIPKRVQPDILKTVTDIAFAEVEIDD